MRNVKSLFVIVLMMMLASCVGLPKQMQWASKPLEVSSSQAKMVFMRNTTVLGIYGAQLYRMVDGKPIYLGDSGNGTRVETAAPEGHHVFMITTGSFDSGEFMEADVVAGKTYYTVVTPNWGLMRFFLHPVHRNTPARFTLTSKDFRDLLKSTKPVELKVSRNIDLENISPSEQVLSRYQMFRQKTDKDIFEVTTRQEDGE